MSQNVTSDSQVAASNIFSPRPNMNPVEREEFDKVNGAALTNYLIHRDYDIWGEASIIKGWVAAAAGQLMTDCPYKDTRTANGRITFSRAYRRAWERGYQQFLYWLNKPEIWAKWGKK